MSSRSPPDWMPSSHIPAEEWAHRPTKRKRLLKGVTSPTFRTLPILTLLSSMLTGVIVFRVFVLHHFLMLLQQCHRSKRRCDGFGKLRQTEDPSETALILESRSLPELVRARSITLNRSLLLMSDILQRICRKAMRVLGRIRKGDQPPTWQTLLCRKIAIASAFLASC